MTPTIPIPTDSIYKFYALCGLAIVISSMVSLVYLADRFNERIEKNYVQWEVLNRMDKLSPEEAIKKDVLKTRLDADRFDKKALPIALGSLGGIGLLIMLGGFIAWHKRIQAHQDKLLELQIKKLEREIFALDKELAETPPGPADAEALRS